MVWRCSFRQVGKHLVRHNWTWQSKTYEDWFFSAWCVHQSRWDLWSVLQYKILSGNTSVRVKQVFITLTKMKWGFVDLTLNISIPSALLDSILGTIWLWLYCGQVSHWHALAIIYKNDFRLSYNCIPDGSIWVYDQKYSLPINGMNHTSKSCVLWRSCTIA